MKKNKKINFPEEHYKYDIRIYRITNKIKELIFDVFPGINAERNINSKLKRSIKAVT